MYFVKLFYQLSVRQYVKSDIRDVPGRPGRPFPNVADGDIDTGKKIKKKTGTVEK